MARFLSFIALGLILLNFSSCKTTETHGSVELHESKNYLISHAILDEKIYMDGPISYLILDINGEKISGNGETKFFDKKWSFNISGSKLKPGKYSFEETVIEGYKKGETRSGHLTERGDFYDMKDHNKETVYTTFTKEEFDTWKTKFDKLQLVNKEK